MELLCYESNFEAEVKAYDDAVLLEDDRVLENLLTAEDKYCIPSCYFKCMQTELTPYMRKCVATWMLEVCEEERCTDSVYSLAMNCLDRFLSIVRIRKDQLQLLGAACLLIASKIRQSRALSTKKLCVYTDCSITVDDLANWELLILSKLKWDLCAIIPNDFVGLIIQRLPLAKGTSVVRRHAEIFVSLCAADFKFSIYPPSMIAAASIGAAVEGLMWAKQHWNSQQELLCHLQQITGIEMDCLRECLDHVEEILSTHLSAAKQLSSSNSVNDYQKLGQVASADLEDCTTPTDVQDVQF